MITGFFGKCKEYLKEAINQLNGVDRRNILGAMAEEKGRGGQSFIAKEFNAGRNTIRKGSQEFKSGVKLKDEFNKRGRKKTENILQNLKLDIADIVEPSCQIDPKFRSTRLYTRLTVPKIRELLVTEKGYSENELPSNVTLNRIVNDCGYKLRRVLKVKPIKKIKETDKIFDNLKIVHDATKDAHNIARISLDAKDKVKLGEFSRGGKSRKETKASDHDFGVDCVTPFGILDVKAGKTDIYLTKSKITADFIADRLEEYWDCKNFNKQYDTLLLNSDNGPESSSQRTQFMKRMIEFSAKADIEIILAYYPPYHSKYNPIERVWASLEKHWNGDILDSVEAVKGFAESMTWKGIHPDVSVVNEIYETGIKLKKKTMKIYELALERADEIGKWFLKIKPEKAREILEFIAQT